MPAGGGLDLTTLCIVPGKCCWVLNLDILVLAMGGSVPDAASIAVKVGWPGGKAGTEWARGLCRRQKEPGSALARRRTSVDPTQAARVQCCRTATWRGVGMQRLHWPHRPGPIRPSVPQPETPGPRPPAQAALATSLLPKVELVAGQEEGDEPDYEIDDDPSVSVSLDVGFTPLILTVGCAASCCCLDLTLEEEACCPVAVSVGVDAQGQFAGLTKRQEGGLSPDELLVSHWDLARGLVLGGNGGQGPSLPHLLTTNNGAGTFTRLQRMPCGAGCSGCGAEERAGAPCCS